MCHNSNVCQNLLGICTLKVLIDRLPCRFYSNHTQNLSPIKHRERGFRQVVDHMRTISWVAVSLVPNFVNSTTGIDHNADLVDPPCSVGKTNAVKDVHASAEKVGGETRNR